MSALAALSTFAMTCSGGREPEDGGAAEPCAALARAACEERAGRFECYPVLAYDVTRETAAGEPCYDTMQPAREPAVLIRCAPWPHAGTGATEHAVPPGSEGQCLFFPSSSDVPADWTLCREVMAACPPE